jgi:hypothetical protein
MQAHLTYILFIYDYRTYLKINNSSDYRHPRAGGGSLKALKDMDSRLRGNDTCSLS